MEDKLFLATGTYTMHYYMPEESLTYEFTKLVYATDAVEAADKVERYFESKTEEYVVYCYHNTIKIEEPIC